MKKLYIKKSLNLAKKLYEILNRLSPPNRLLLVQSLHPDKKELLNLEPKVLHTGDQI